MLASIRRSALGIAVVAVASAILLLSDLGHRGRAAARAVQAKKHVWKIFFIQYNDVIDVKDADERGVLDGLAESGFVNGQGYEVQILNAQEGGEWPPVSALIDETLTGSADLLIKFSTPSAESTEFGRRFWRVVEPM